MTTTDDRLVFPAHAWPLFKEALQHIADHPDEFYMREYVAFGHHLTDVHIADIVEATGHPFPTCGTVACLAGRIALLDGADTDIEPCDSMRALEALGIDATLAQDGACESFDDPVAEALEGVFQKARIRTYAELRDELESRFVFPGPLPVPSAVGA